MYKRQRVNSGLPALFGVKASAGKAFESEREILYQVLFDMRRDVTELKKLVNTLMSERGAQPVPPPATTAVSYYQEPQRNLVATVVPATPTIISAAKSCLLYTSCSLCLSSLAAWFFWKRLQILI